MLYDANKPNKISELKDEIHRVIHDLRLELERDEKFRQNGGCR